MAGTESGILIELNREIDPILETGLFTKGVATTNDPDLEHFIRQGHRIVGILLQFGDHYFELLRKDADLPVIEKQKAYVTTYFWAEQAKAFMVLWRDILFEVQKGKILQQLKVVSPEQLEQLLEQSSETVREAAATLDQYLEKQLQILRKGKGGADKKIRQLKLQENPWPVYRQHLSAIDSQLDDLLASYQNLTQTSNAFQEIHQHLQQTLEAFSREIDEHLQIAGDTIQAIESQPEAKPARIVSQLEDMEGRIQLTNFTAEFVDQSDKSTTPFGEKIQVPVDTAGAQILFKEVNFRRSISQWLDSEIHPPLFEMWELTELNANSLKMALLNIRNRALLLAPDQKEGKTPDFDHQDLTQPLHNFLRKSATLKQGVENLRNLITERLRQDFQFSLIFHTGDTFLQAPLQSTINKLRVNQSALVTTVRSWVNRQSGAFRTLRRAVEQEESLSVPEKVVRYLQSRNWEAVNTHYNSLFLTKGYIGESFWVGRQNELDHLEQLIRNWENGFRGAVALTGQRLAGKSLMGELVANRFFSQNTIRLQPQSGIRIKGRRMTTTYDLEEAIIFIRKHTLNDPHLIWIDDLELWRDPNIPLGKNVMTLRRFIDDYSNQLFFLVSMSNSLRHHLERFLEIPKVFQAEINLDKMPLKDVREAIIIRHGATHKELLDVKGREVSPQQFQRMTAKAYKAANGNIGEALNIWAFSTQAIDEDRVIHQLSTLYELPDFLTPDNALLLTSTVMARKINEYRLRKLFGPIFTEKYRGSLQRLISIGLLRRGPDGWLEVVEAAANDLGRLLERKNYLKYHR